MVRLWKTFSLTRSSPYQLARLVDARVLITPPQEPGCLHVVCDIDKTYLETEFESIVRMARIAFEEAVDKVTVAGAADVLQAARWGDPDGLSTPDYPRSLHFVSSSPPQLRAVLEEKLAMDGLDWNSDTFKNQAYNIRMGRMDLLRHHVAYKSQAILNLVRLAGPDARFYMIGDNAESDAYIYTGIRLLLEGRLSKAGYKTYLEVAGVEPSVAEDLCGRLTEEKRGSRVVAILIRRVPGYQPVAQPPLTDVALPFDNFFQAALLLVAHGLIAPETLVRLTRAFHNQYGLARDALDAALQALSDAVPAHHEAVNAALHLLRSGGQAQELSLGAKHTSDLPEESSDLGLQGQESDLTKSLAVSGMIVSKNPSGAPGADPAHALRLSLSRDFMEFNQLNEPDILRLARLWMQQMQAARND